MSSVIEMLRAVRRSTAAALMATASTCLPSGASAQTGTTPDPAGQPPTRFRIALNGAATVPRIEFDESIRFTEFAEEGRLEAAFAAASGKGIDVGAQLDVTHGFGVAWAFTLTRRDNQASYSTRLPHPFFLDQPRIRAGDVSGLDYKETAIHLDVVYGGKSGALAFQAFAGATLFRVEADLLDRVRYTQVYPYDDAQVTVTAVPTVSARDNPVGYNAGAGIDYRFGRTFGVGVQGRFSRAQATLKPAGGAAVSLDAGGFALAAGARLYF